MATTEHTINDALAEALRNTRQLWRDSEIVKSENTGMLSGSHERPDILVLEANVSPVVIETEVLPAITVEVEARSRLGKHISHTGRTILSAIAVRLPERLKTKQGAALRSELAQAADLEIALFTGGEPAQAVRWPHSGWLQGSVADLSLLAQSASLPPNVIDAAADKLTVGVQAAAGILEEIAASHPGAAGQMSHHLRQEDGPQTRRMAAAILANAFMFQEMLAGGPDELANVQSVEQLRGSDDGLGKSSVLDEWRKILKVNYWPIFDIARRVLELIPAHTSGELIAGLAKTAERLQQDRLMRSHDLMGAVFQRLIVDRKFLAAYYTTPASAALLLGLALTPDRLPNGGDWADPAAVSALRIADFACGTGTLLSTAYQRIGQLHELAGGDAEALHPQMMATALVGCDVLPAAAHLTASMLSSAHPTVKYEGSSILTVAYGKQPDGSIALGSLDLLDAQGRLENLAITARGIEGMGEREKNTWSALPHASFDLVIMNPPFTRATNHEGAKADVPNPMFGAFSSTAEEQALMGKATERLTKGTSAHGNAGLASIFLALADRKLKDGGTLALVMPLSLLAGSSWKASRTLLAAEYSDVVVISIAGVDGSAMSFSADTGMGECLIIGRRTTNPDKRGVFVVLNEPPTYPLLGATVATQIWQLLKNHALRRLEDGPFGGSTLRFGDTLIGQALEAPLEEADGWSLSRISDLSLAQVAHQLIAHGLVWLPGTEKANAFSTPLTPIADIGKVGPVDRDVNGREPDGAIRGPFELFPAGDHHASTYPVLWEHVAARERCMVFEADHEGVPYQGNSPAEQQKITQKVERVWATASHCHSNRDFQFNSQSTAMQFTPRKTIGGRAWLSVQLASPDLEKALVLWSNTTFGLLLFWWHSSKQQSGRGIITKQTLQTLPVLDVTQLTPEQLAAAVRIFDDLSESPLLPVHEIDHDAARKELDTRFLREVLAAPESLLEADGPMDLLRWKLSREPSIRGSKK